MQNPYLYVIVLLHAGFAGALLLLRGQRPSRFVQRFAWSWAIEAVRAAILLPEVHNLGGRSGEWFCLADVLCFFANWFLFSACADLAEVRLPRWLAPVYLGAGIPLVLLGRYVAPLVLRDWFGWTWEEGRFHGVLSNLIIMFVPVTAARVIILVWLFRLWSQTRLPGALVAALFCVPYALIAVAVPFQFYFSYNPAWVSLVWVFRVFGFSIGIVMLLLSRQQTALAQSEQRYRQIVETAGEGIWQIDGENRTTFVNQRMAEMLGYTVAEMDGASMFEFMDEEGKALAAANVERRQRGIKEQHDFKFRRKDGRDLWAIVSTDPIFDSAGRYAGALGLITDITDRKHFEVELQLSQDVLRALTPRLQAVREEERTRIAREIHDVLAQELTRLKIDLAWASKRLAKPADEPTRLALAEKIREMTSQTDAAISAVQEIATELRPVVLDSLGLSAAVEWLGEDFAHRTGIRCRATVPAEPLLAGRDQSTACFRILQESLTNVLRHARATEVEVSLRQDDEALTLTVRDNGVGITEKKVHDRHSIGLVGMSERAGAFGGTVRISGAPGAGTTVMVRLPLVQEGNG